MNNNKSEQWDKIRQQFDTSPFPRIPIDQSPKDDVQLLYLHNLTTSYYLRNQKVIDTKDKIILDAGCGTGYKSLVLAEANPGAKIVGIDISEESVKLARQRLKYHGFENTEFYTLSIYDLPELNYQFDYINCDETLYLLPDLLLALKAMKAVLNPDGVIRSNLHNYHIRHNMLRAQELFSFLGVVDTTPGELEAKTVREVMRSFNDNVNLKSLTWHSGYEAENQPERILMNFLLQGDKGFTINDLFSALNEANLEFIKMTNWRKWDLRQLFKNPDNLPNVIEKNLQNISSEEQLKFFALVQPLERLLDFWCGHPQAGHTFTPIDKWTDTEWENATVHIHPQYNNSGLKKNVINCVSEGKTFRIYKNLALTEEFVYIDSAMALCLFLLLETSLPMMSLVEKWRTFRPLDPLTGEPIEKIKVFHLLQKLLLVLESFDLIMLEIQS